MPAGGLKEDGVEHECLVIKNGMVKRVRADVDKSCLKEIKIPAGVAVIGECAFDGCESLASVEIPASVKHIEEYAFRGCESLESVKIPASVTFIGEGAFDGCKGLKCAK